MSPWLFIYTLRARLIFLVLLALLPALAIMLYTATETRQYEIDRAHENINTLTQLVASREEQLIEGARQFLIAMAQLQEVRQDDLAACQTRLASLLTLYPSYRYLGVADLEGNVNCSSTTPSSDPPNVAVRPWFQHALETRNFTVGDYQVGRTSGVGILIFGYPVLNEAGQPQAVAFAVKEVDTFSLTEDVRLPNHETSLMVLDRHGTVLDYYPNPDRWVGQSLTNLPLVQLILSRDRGEAKLPGPDGLTRVYTFTPLQSPVDTGLHLAVGISEDAISSEADQIWRRNLILLGLMGAMALAAAWIGGDVFILRRLQMLVSAANRLRKGDLSTRTGMTSHTSEFNQLAGAFDDMAAALQQREAERQQTMADLEAQRAFLRQVIDINPNFIFAKDRQGRFTLANQAVADAYGTTVENLLGKTDADFNPAAAEVEHFQHDDLEVMDSLQEKFIPEESITDDARQVRYLQTVKRPLLGPDGRANQVLGVSTDITERKRNEQVQNLLAESRERSRLGQELHDTVAQALGYLNLQIGLTASLITDNRIDQAQANLHELKQIVGEVYTDVREEIFNLRANTYVGLGFLELLDKYIDKYHRFYNLDIQLSGDIKPAHFEFPPQVTPQLIRTIQEALINIRKHAKVNQAIIRLERQDRQVRITIEDQGQGFDPAQVKDKATSFGLQIMQERIESVGGSLEIETAPGQGARIIITYTDP